MRRTAASLLWLGAFACAPNSAPASADLHVAKPCEGRLERRYVPGALLPSLPGRASADDWMNVPSLVLDAMHEPPLSCGVVADSYRVLWLSGFNTSPGRGNPNPPTMVRMVRTSTAWTVVGVQLASAANREETVRRQRTLSDDEAREMLIAVSGFGIWNRPDFAWNPDVNDGALWLIEGRRGSDYHPAVLANSDVASVRRLADVFLRMAGIDPHQGATQPKTTRVRRS